MEVKKAFGILVLALSLGSVCQGFADGGETGKAVPQTSRIEQFMDLRHGFARKPLKVENAKIYKEPFGSVTYWGPKTLDKWAEIQYRFDFPFAVEEVSKAVQAPRQVE